MAICILLGLRIVNVPSARVFLFCEWSVSQGFTTEQLGVSCASSRVVTVVWTFVVFSPCDSENPP